VRFLYCHQLKASSYQYFANPSIGQLMSQEA